MILPIFFSSAALPFAALVITACAQPTAVGRDPAAAMVGEWTYAQTPSPQSDAPSLSVGLQVSIAIDSATDMRFWGHVARWMVGDVGVPTNRFGSVSGEVDSAYGISLRIKSAAIRGLRIDGVVEGDTLTVHASWSGGDPGPFPQGGLFQRLH